MDLLGDAGDANGRGYRVLARAYRPAKLSELIGQEILVRALTNAFASGRIAHAFLLSGIRGVGKTTTARIIARALNCTGEDDQGGPTPEPCGVCSSCRSMASDSALDVIEMDAATHTGINDIREIVESIGYAPAASRYKVYIIDEVHMLSMNAFNGLLKTLEEPPPHVKFIFATTEARKVPITVLSRCQRFDLRRVEVPVLHDHLGQICVKEKVEADPPALTLIAKAAEGSVRDSLSLLDQAIALSGDAAGNQIEAVAVARMLGFGNQDDMLALLGMLLEGQTGLSVERVRELYASGAEPVSMVQDLLELTHELTTIQADVAANSALLMGDQATRTRELTQAHGLERFSRFWQMLLKGLDEVRNAPQPLSAMEMLCLRLACASALPPPGDLLRLLRQTEHGQDGPGHESPGPSSQAKPSQGPGPVSMTSAMATARPALRQPVAEPMAAIDLAGDANQQIEPEPLPATFDAMIAVLRRGGQPLIAATLEQSCRLINFQPLRLTLCLEPNLAADFSGKLAQALKEATGQRWVIALEREGGAATLMDQRRAEKERLIVELAQAPEVRHVLDTIPGAKIVDVRPRSADKPAN